MKRWSAWWAVVAMLLSGSVGCGQKAEGEAQPEAQPETQSLDLQAIQSVQLLTGEEVRIHFVVLRKHETAPLTFTVEGLPVYGRQDGPELILAPGPNDVGSAEITVTVSDGKLTDTERFSVRVVPSNQLPRLNYIILTDYDGTTVNPTLPTVMKGSPLIIVSSSDPDRDAYELLLEVVPLEAEFSGQPTHRFPRGSLHYLGDWVEGLPEGVHLKARAWLMDARGAVSAVWPLWSDLVQEPRPDRPAGPVWETCDGARVDLATDSRHCGGCGYDCGTAACSHMVCEAEPMAQSLAPLPMSLAASEDALFWGHITQVTRFPKLKGPGTVISPPGIGAPLLLAGSDLFFGFDAFRHLSLTTGELTDLPGSSPSTRLAVHDGRLYWSETTPLIDFWRHGLIKSVALTGDALTVVHDEEYAPVSDLRAAAEGLYFASDDSLLMLPWSGGGRRVLLQGLGVIRSIAVDAEAVYVARGWNQDCEPDRWCTVITRVPKDGGSRRDLAMSYGLAGALEVDDTYVYWTSQGRIWDLPLSEGVVMKAPKAGGPARILAGGRVPAGPQLVLDGPYVYWFTKPPGGVQSPFLNTLYRSPR